jgi:hypothetical protein
MLDPRASAHSISDQAELLIFIAAPHFEDPRRRREGSAVAYSSRKATRGKGVGRLRLLRAAVGTVRISLARTAIWIISLPRVEPDALPATRRRLLPGLLRWTALWAGNLGRG